ncbi:predicted MFS family arabinose efflux permease [Jatrophihabitans sp. GAS493]|nr:predicted MFS family arabinose efflux permease [Jatrophihabitans sp. GAS493]
MVANIETVDAEAQLRVPETNVPQIAGDSTTTSAVRRRRGRDFRRYWVAGAVDAMGSHAATIVVPLIVLGAGGSVTLAGAVATLSIGVETLVEPVAGVLADRVSRRSMMIVAALFAAAAALALALVVAQDGYRLDVVVALVLAEAIATASYGAAAQGAIRQLLPPDDPQPALAALQARDQGAALVGPPVGGLLFSLTRWAPLLFNAISYVVTAVLVAGIRTDLTPTAAVDRERVDREPEDPRDSFLQSSRAGLRLVFGHPFLRFALSWGAGINAVFATVYYVVLLNAASSGASAAAIGVLLGVASGLGLVGSLAAPTVLRRVAPTKLIPLTSWVMVVLVAAMGLTGELFAQGLLLGTVLLISPAVSILFQSYAIATVPVEMQGRAGGVMGFFLGLSLLAAPVSAGLMVQWLAGWAVTTVLAALLALLAVYARTGTQALLDCASAIEEDLADASESSEPSESSQAPESEVEA